MIKVESARVGKIFRLITALSVIILMSDGICPTYGLEPPPITPVEEFFIFNNSGVPAVPTDWRLRVEGEVANPLEFMNCSSWKSIKNRANPPFTRESKAFANLLSVVTSTIPVR